MSKSDELSKIREEIDSIDDQISRNDWNWESRFNLESIVNEMLTNLK